MLMFKSTHKKLMDALQEDVDCYRDRYNQEWNRATSSRQKFLELERILNSFKRNPFLVFPWFLKNKIRNFLR